MNRRRRLSFLLAGLAVCALAPVIQGRKAPNIFADTSAGTSVADAGRLDWWRDARFGLFIHWGPVSLKGTEISWSRANSNPLCPNKGDIPVEVYDNLYKSFNPTLFDAVRWAAMAKAAGMRYVVLTAKHCDGFCLWRSAESDHHIGLSPFPRDICGELAEAVRKAGLRIGWYYSPMDWRDPDCRTREQRGLRQAHARPDPRARHTLRPDRRPLVRLGRRNDPLGPGGDLSHSAPGPALDHHQQPLGLQLRRAFGRPRYGPERRLPDARAGDRGVQRPAAVGDVHDPGDPVVLEAGRPDQVRGRSHPHPGRVAPAATGTCSSTSGRCRTAASNRARSMSSRVSEPGWTGTAQASTARGADLSNPADTAPRRGETTSFIFTSSLGTVRRSSCRGSRRKSSAAASSAAAGSRCGRLRTASTSPSRKGTGIPRIRSSSSSSTARRPAFRPWTCPDRP